MVFSSYKTREERKLDAIMKVFEKMEKREEQKKKTMARGDQGSKRSSIDSKTLKVFSAFFFIVLLPTTFSVSSFLSDSVSSLFSCHTASC